MRWSTRRSERTVSFDDQTWMTLSENEVGALLEQASKLDVVGGHRAASQVLQRLLTIMPGDPAVRLALARSRYAMGDWAGARRLAWTVARQNPELPESWLLLARIDLLLGDLEGVRYSIRYLEQRVDVLDPNERATLDWLDRSVRDVPPAGTDGGQADAGLGDAAVCSQALRLRDAGAEPCWLTRAEQVRTEAGCLELLETLQNAELGALNVAERIAMELARGALHHRLGHHREAVAAWTCARALMARPASVVEDGRTQQVSPIRGVEGSHSAPEHGRCWTIVVGTCPSDAAAVRALLADHPDVDASVPRLTLRGLTERVGLSSSLGFSDGLDGLSDQELSRLGAVFRSGFPGYAGEGVTLVDEAVDSLDQLELAVRLIPNLRVVNVCRNVVDAALEIYRSPLSVDGRCAFQGLDEAFGWASRRTRRLAAWERSLSGRMHSVRVEASVSSTSDELERLYRFLGVDEVSGRRPILRLAAGEGEAYAQWMGVEGSAA